jgi:hypothetical protein
MEIRGGGGCGGWDACFRLTYVCNEACRTFAGNECPAYHLAIPIHEFPIGPWFLNRDIDPSLCPNCIQGVLLLVSRGNNAVGWYPSHMSSFQTWNT